MFSAPPNGELYAYRHAVDFVFIAYASGQGSDESTHLYSFARNVNAKVCFLLHWPVAKAKAQASLRSCCMNTKHKFVFNFPKYVYFRSFRIRENAQSFRLPG